MLTPDPMYASAFASVLCFLGYLYHRHRAQHQQLQQVLQQYMPTQDSSTQQGSVLV